MTMQSLSARVQELVTPLASELVNAMMRSYSLAVLTEGNLLIPMGKLHQTIDDHYLLEGNLHSFSDKGPWHAAKATLRLCIESRGTVLQRMTLINCWFDYGIFDRAFSNFQANRLDETALRQAIETHAGHFKWDFGRDIEALRY